VIITDYDCGVMMFAISCLRIGVGNPLSLVFITRQLSHRGRKFNYESALELLGVKAGSGEVDIRRAYLDKARIYHPDSPSGCADVQMFSEVFVYSTCIAIVVIYVFSDCVLHFQTCCINRCKKPIGFVCSRLKR